MHVEHQVRMLYYTCQVFAIQTCTTMHFTTDQQDESRPSLWYLSVSSFIRSARRTFGTNAGKWVQTAAWCCGSLININSSHYGSLHLIPGPLCLLFIHFSGIAESAACSVSATEWIFSYRTTFICEHLGSTPPFVTRSDVMFLSFGNAFCWWVRLSVCRRTLTYCVDRDC